MVSVRTRPQSNCGRSTCPRTSPPPPAHSRCHTQTQKHLRCFTWISIAVLCYVHLNQAPPVRRDSFNEACTSTWTAILTGNKERWERMVMNIADNIQRLITKISMSPLTRWPQFSIYFSHQVWWSHTNGTTKKRRALEYCMRAGLIEIC